MKHKKSLLAFAFLGVFTFAGLVAPSAFAFTDHFKLEDTYVEGENNMYYIDANKINIECPSGSTTYKVDKNYDATKPTWFRADETCTDIAFDLDGKTVENGAITIPGGVTITMQDSVGTGYFANLGNSKNAYLDSTINTQVYGSSSDSTVVVQGGHYSGNFRSNGRKLRVYINGGTFNTALEADTSTTIDISGGTFSEKPDEKYIGSYSAVYEEDGKYIVDRRFTLTDFFQYMYTGQVSTAYVSPGIIAKTAKVTSSDESIIGVVCKDSTIIPGQMMLETSDGSVGSKACTITAKKAGKATISYATDYDYEGSVMIYVADIDATDYDNGAENAKYTLTARYLSVFAADPLDYSWLSTAPSAVSGDFDPVAVRNRYSGITDAIKSGHKIKLAIEFSETTLVEDEQKLVDVVLTSVLDGYNIAAVYSPAGSVIDLNTNKTLLEQTFGFTTLPLPEILKNRSRTIQVVSISKDPEWGYGISANIGTTTEGDKLYIAGASDYGLYGDKIVVFYDGSPINPDGTTDDVPATPNSGFEEDLSGENKSVAIILGASAAVLLVIAALLAHVIYRKKSLSKVHF